jgi:polar amino acid transport system substrate-binding protein
MYQALLLIFSTVFFLSAQAENFRVAVGLALPPYVISDSNQGMELDIFQEAMALNGHTTEIVYMPFARVPLSLQKGLVDAAMTVNEDTGLDNIYLSDIHITYQNVVLSLQEKNLSIKQISDLQPLTLMGFQNANLYLGDEFKKMSETNANYAELADQKNQIKMLFLNRVNAIVADINIYKYYKQAIQDIDTTREVKIHPIFPKSHYKVGFLSEDSKNAFNNSLTQLKESGRYDEIINFYLNGPNQDLDSSLKPN